MIRRLNQLLHLQLLLLSLDDRNADALVQQRHGRCAARGQEKVQEVLWQRHGYGVKLEEEGQ